MWPPEPHPLALRTVPAPAPPCAQQVAGGPCSSPALGGLASIAPPPAVGRLPADVITAYPSTLRASPTKDVELCPRSSAGLATSPSSRQRRTTTIAPADPQQAAQSAKQAAILLRDARAVQRRFDKLAASVVGADPSILRHLADVREALDRLVAQLAHEERGKHRRAQQAQRRGR
jgi:hypothetical protein